MTDLMRACPLARHPRNLYHIRWFSSSSELPLCGHATFGAAKFLQARAMPDTPTMNLLCRSRTSWLRANAQCRLQAQGCRYQGVPVEITFRSRAAGNLLVKLPQTEAAAGESAELQLSLESLPPVALAPTDELLTDGQLFDALGVAASSVRYVGLNKYDLMIELDAVAKVEALEPDQAKLAQIQTRGSEKAQMHHLQS